MNAWSPASISVAIAHRNPLVRTGLATILTSEPDFEVDIVAATEAGTRQALAAEVVVADYETAMELLGGTRGATGPRVMVVSHRDRESEIRHALDRGVHGYLLLGCELDEMIFGVRKLHRGQHHVDQSAAQRVVESLNHQALTMREGDVLRLIAVGHVNKTIASELDISVGTVKAHVKAILAKFGAKTRTEAAAIAQRRGLLESNFSS